MQTICSEKGPRLSISSNDSRPLLLLTLLASIYASSLDFPSFIRVLLVITISFRVSGGTIDGDKDTHASLASARLHISPFSSSRTVFSCKEGLFG